MAMLPPEKASTGKGAHMQGRLWAFATRLRFVAAAVAQTILAAMRYR